VNGTIAKNIQLTQGTRLQLRADAFNVFNQKNYGNPTLATNNANFGVITSAGSARTMQVGARLSF
jgi:hypothetical protein